jgi:hypothetical protein
MRLISSIHDYYDSMFRGVGRDDPSIFIRETTTGLAEVPGLLRCDMYDSTYSYTLRAGIIGFCGFIYPFVKVIKHTSFTYESIADQYYYNYDALLKAIPLLDQGKVKYRRGCRNELNHFKLWLEEGKIKHYFSSSTDVKNDPNLLKLFTGYKVAYFSYLQHDGVHNKKSNIELYPVLKSFQFYKVMDLVSAYQKIEMFVCNELVKPDCPYIEPVPDKIKAESHGYDKFSFRKEKSSK